MSQIVPVVMKGTDFVLAHMNGNPGDYFINQFPAKNDPIGDADVKIGSMVRSRIIWFVSSGVWESRHPDTGERFIIDSRYGPADYKIVGSKQIICIEKGTLVCLFPRDLSVFWARERRKAKKGEEFELETVDSKQMFYIDSGLIQINGRTLGEHGLVSIEPNKKVTVKILDDTEYIYGKVEGPFTLDEGERNYQSEFYAND